MASVCTVHWLNFQRSDGKITQDSLLLKRLDLKSSKYRYSKGATNFSCLFLADNDIEQIISNLTNKIFSLHADFSVNTHLLECSFIGCRSKSEGGGVLGNGCHLRVERCVYLECHSECHSGGLAVKDGALEMSCTVFELCYASGGDTNNYGMAFGTTQSRATCNSTSIFRCWNSTKESKDGIFGMTGGDVVVQRLNMSHSISKGGILAGHYISINTEPLLSFFNIENSEEDMCLAVYYDPLVFNYLNVINNSINGRMSCSYGPILEFLW